MPCSTSAAHRPSLWSDPSATRRRPVPLRVAAAGFAATVALSGCAGGAGSGDDGSGSSGSDSRYVAGDGSATTYDKGERKRAPDVDGTTLDGDNVSLDDYKGEVLVINFWASWCVPCRTETPVLNEVYSDHKDDGLEFLGVNIKDDETAATSYEEKQDVAYPSIHDQPGEVSQAFRDTVPPKAIPSTLVLDRDGRIAARVIGAVKYRQLSDLVEPLVKNGGKNGKGDDDSDAGGT